MVIQMKCEKIVNTWQFKRLYGNINIIEITINYLS